jgi:ribonuclease HI
MVSCSYNFKGHSTVGLGNVMRAYTLIFDGGSLGNPGDTYGSYRIQQKGEKPQSTVRLRFGHGTNNEAEYWALIAGLKDLHQQITQQKVNPSEVHVEIIGDSQLVVNQLRGSWKAKNQRMRALRDESKAILDRFGSRSIEAQSRWKTVRILGH